MHAVIETPTYLKQAAGLNESERDQIVSFLSNNPTAGELIPGTGGLRKVRFRKPGKGKSGGYRTIHYYAADDIPLFLMALVDKGKRADISKAERNELRKVVAGIADDYRAGLRRKREAMKKSLRQAL
jgi:hypothetical protein